MLLAGFRLGRVKAGVHWSGRERMESAVEITMIRTRVEFWKKDAAIRPEVAAGRQVMIRPTAKNDELRWFG